MQASAAQTAACACRTTWRRHAREAPASSPLPPPKYPPYLVGGSVPRRRWDDPEVEGFLRRLQPVILTGGCPLTRELVGKWDLHYLADAFGGDYDRLSVHFAPTSTTAFARHYGKGLGAGGVREMNFPGFVELVDAEHLGPREGVPPSPYRYYLQVPLLWNEHHDGMRKGSNGPPQPAASPTQWGKFGGGGGKEPPLTKAPFGPRLEADLTQLGWEWLAKARSISGCDPFDTAQLWVGHGGGSTPLHFDAISNLLCQIKGRKRVLLFPPAQTWNVYPYPVGHEMDNFSMVDLESPDLERFPGLKRAKGLEAVLTPGDVLWLPRFWWHYVAQADEVAENVSLNFWLGLKGADDFLHRLGHAPLPPADEVHAAARQSKAEWDAAWGAGDELAIARLEAADDALLSADDDLAFRCLHAGRVIEKGATKLFDGDTQVGGAFLQAIAAGAEARWAAELPQTQKALRLRTEIMAVVGMPAANALFRQVGRDGRLSPGLAPKVEGPIVNSEAGNATSQAELERMLGVDRARIGVRPRAQARGA